MLKSEHDEMVKLKKFDPRVLPVPLPLWGHLANRAYNELYIIKRSPVKWDWYVHGITFLPFEFLILTPMSSYSFETLVMPFDAWIWTATLISFGATVAILTVLTASSHLKGSLFKNFWDKVFWTISVIFDQTDTEFTSVEFKSTSGSVTRMLQVWIAIWYFITFFLGMVYKGSLFSWLTATLPLTVPTSLESLVDSDWPIVTITAGKTELGATSILKFSIIPDLLYGIKPSTELTGEGKMYNFLTKLNNKVEFITGNVFEIGLNVTENRRVQSFSNSTVKFNLPCVILDEVSKLNALVGGITMFTNPAIVRNHEMTPFISRVPWHGERNFLYPLFARGLGQLVQSGIFSKWDQFDQISEQLGGARGLNKTHKGIVTKSRYNMVREVKKKIQFAEASAVSISAMKYAFSFCAMILCLGLVAFVGEVYNFGNVANNFANNFASWRNPTDIVYFNRDEVRQKLGDTGRKGRADKVDFDVPQFRFVW
ncbi:hypothetical protein Fcan01_19572 [Folsomia candida]|uniref:Uncharacterized protein n=1 Tax=Folsomia candida TaxID=158441 RepID=A0A226DLS6_FOLCA|nr:hypothetical protein Fcan01_19572 [Folsomia candida]